MRDDRVLHRPGRPIGLRDHVWDTAPHAYVSDVPRGCECDHRPRRHPCRDRRATTRAGSARTASSQL